jgi:hypothetical protein
MIRSNTASKMAQRLLFPLAVQRNYRPQFGRFGLVRAFAGATLVAVLANAPGAWADTVTVNFTNWTAGPTTTLYFPGVTVTGTSPPATVSGFGLGMSNGVGPVYELDRQMHFPAGQVAPDSDLLSGTLVLNIDGTVSTLTVLPIFRVYNGSTLTSDTLSFGLAADFSGGPEPPFRTLGAPNGLPVTLFPDYMGTPPSMTQLQMQIASSGGEFNDYFLTYREQHIDQEQTYQFGISIQAVSYTAVPEPATGAYLGLGLLGWLARRRLSVTRKRS